MLKEKRKGTELEIKTFYDSDNRAYTVYKHTTESGANSYHVFTEVEAKDIAKKLGVEKDTTVEAWNILWQN